VLPIEDSPGCYSLLYNPRAAEVTDCCPRCPWPGWRSRPKGVPRQVCSILSRTARLLQTLPPSAHFPTVARASLASSSCLTSQFSTGRQGQFRHEHPTSDTVCDDLHHLWMVITFQNSFSELNSSSCWCFVWKSTSKCKSELASWTGHLSARQKWFVCKRNHCNSPRKHSGSRAYFWWRQTPPLSQPKQWGLEKWLG